MKDCGVNRPCRPRSVCAPHESGSTLPVYLPAPLHDQIVKLAETRRESVSATVRALIIPTLAGFSTEK